MSTKKKGAPPCGLWLRVGPDLALDLLMRDLKQIYFTINGSAYEKNMHVLEISGPEINNESDPDFKAKAAVLFAMARDNGMATIYRGDAAFAHELEADGVLLRDIKDLPAARDLFGEDGIIGMACGLSNEDAAAAYDAGADFVSFGAKNKGLPSADILTFWTMLTDKPALIEGAVTNDYCGYFVQAGAGFIDSGDYIWGHGKGVMQGTVNMLHAIEIALEQGDKAVQ
ncbi:MAG: thiamine phosphate synthase [Rhodospirillales bacterium]|nr:thiamine phosphate synthase [Rhodospirillales bacterium]MCB9997190.1 thiamine phosphate synthase [Rhodospirillales bacterium]